MEVATVNLNWNEEGQRKLHAIFPEEVWLIICDMMLDPIDQTSLSQASPFWRNLLRPKMILCMFPQVFPILMKQRFLIHQDKKLRLNLRLVCKQWKLGVDRHLETSSQYSNLKFKRFNHDVAGSDLSFSFYFRTSVTSIRDKLQPEIIPWLASCQNTNPFPSRHLEISDLDFLDQEIPPTEDNLISLIFHRVDVERFLKAAGHHFWYAHISIDFEMTAAGWYKTLCKFVTLLPNLKSLYLKCLCSDRSKEIGKVNHRVFPRLRNLEVLCIEDVPYSIANVIFAAVNENIKVLLMPLMSPPQHTDNPEATRLDFSLIRNPQIVSILAPNMKMFKRLPSAWNLRELRLGFPYWPPGNWEGIFQKLEQFKESLTELYIEFPRGYSPMDELSILETSRGALNLPNLKRFSSVIKNYCAIDFLLGLTTLEHLKLCFNPIHTVQPEGDDGTDVINFNNRFSDSFMECNIWELIPSLKAVHLERSRGPEIYKQNK